jgi:hypothetical protein
MGGISIDGGNLKNATGPIAELLKSMGVATPDDKAEQQQIASQGESPGNVVKAKKGGKLSVASRRADGIATRGKTRGKIV